jgi:hypothetical protein
VSRIVYNAGAERKLVTHPIRDLFIILRVAVLLGSCAARVLSSEVDFIIAWRF